MCLLSALSLTARFERIYSCPRFSSAARRWKARGARSFVKGASMSFCKCFALISTVLLTALVALAYCSPPDPTWVSGVYDNADYDDVVGLVTDGAGANDNQALPRVEEGRARYVLLAEWGPAPRWSPADQPSRGPPIDSQDAFAHVPAISSLTSLRIGDVHARDPPLSGLHPELNEPFCFDLGRRGSWTSQSS